MNSIFEEQLFKCDVCSAELPRNEVVKIGYGEENYICCKQCLKNMLDK